MSKELREYLPEPKEQIMLQARVDRELAAKVKSICKLNGWKTVDAVRAGLRKLVDDEGPQALKRRAG